ncbi:MAG: DUF2062 domain-containing protein [Gallionella sp.]|nr:DUF2062 domain-containing protein [Gallionella sp.]
MRKLLQKWMPDHETIRKYRWLQPFAHLLQHHNLWHLHRRSVAGGVAIGLFCGLIPGPLQMLSAALMAVLLRVNLPVALFTTLYTNPFTILPLYVLAYELGSRVSGVHHTAVLTLPELHWNNWWSELWQWLAHLGKPILLGLPLLAVILAVAGYIVVRVLWRVAVILRWRARKRPKIS